MKKVSQLRAVGSQLLSANFSFQLQGKSFCHFTLYPFPVMFFPAAVPGIPHTAERTRVFIRCWGSHITQMASIIIDNKNNYHHFRQPLRAFVAVVLVFQKSRLSSPVRPSAWYSDPMGKNNYQSKGPGINSRFDWHSPSPCNNDDWSDSNGTFFNL